MTQDEIIELAKQAKIGWGEKLGGMPEFLERFAKLVAQHTLSNIDPSKFMSYQEGMESGRLAEREACANTAGLALLGADKALSDRVLKAIRARGQA
jgi:hypothetical protein